MDYLLASRLLQALINEGYSEDFISRALEVNHKPALAWLPHCPVTLKSAATAFSTRRLPRIDVESLKQFDIDREMREMLDKGMREMIDKGMRDYMVAPGMSSFTGITGLKSFIEEHNGRDNSGSKL